ncbi:MAG: hypothetical protein Q9191_001536 [Dirinaria sp. TL-2023a]
MAPTSKRHRTQVEGGEVKQRQSIRAKSKDLVESAGWDNEVTSAEDVGHLESQRFIEATRSIQNKKAAAKNNNFIHDFHKMIVDSQPKTQVLCQEKILGMQAINARLEEAFVFALRATLHDDDIENVELGGSESASNPLCVFRKAESLMSSAKQLLQVYQKLTERMSSTENRGQTGPEWNESSTNLARLITDQGERIKKHVKLRLDEATKTSEKGIDEVVPLKDSTDWALLINHTASPSCKAAEDMPLAKDWGEAAEEVKKGIKRLMKHLPDEED